ncbi:hypothetical protein E2C01_056884 [Portunus trituberculatus]|uniref:Uncharacterized protein n=1 Tax=Portunus trituberculatus TaxID=210409 RepID=A0A5B7H1U8_PORTR|nr:hypothetical protein [Portunus trituberculatus]
MSRYTRPMDNATQRLSRRSKLRPGHTINGEQMAGVQCCGAGWVLQCFLRVPRGEATERTVREVSGSCVNDDKASNGAQSLNGSRRGSAGHLPLPSLPVPTSDPLHPPQLFSFFKSSCFHPPLLHQYPFIYILSRTLRRRSPSSFSLNGGVDAQDWNLPQLPLQVFPPSSPRYLVSLPRAK